MPANKMPDEKVKIVKEHIEHFPKYETNYSRTDNPIEYTEDVISLQRHLLKKVNLPSASGKTGRFLILNTTLVLAGELFHIHTHAVIKHDPTIHAA